MSFLASLKNVLKAQPCGCKKRTRRRTRRSKGKKQRGGFTYRKSQSRGRSHST